MKRLYHFDRLWLGDQLTLPFDEPKQAERIRFAAHRFAERNMVIVRTQRFHDFRCVVVRRVA